MDPNSLPYVDADGDYDEKLDPAIHEVKRQGALRKAKIDALGSAILYVVFEAGLVAVVISGFLLLIGLLVGIVKVE